MVEHIHFLAILLIDFFLRAPMLWVSLLLLIFLVILRKELLVVIFNHVIAEGTNHALVFLPSVLRLHQIALIDIILDHDSAFKLVQFSLQGIYLVLVLLLKLDLVDLENIYFLLFLQ